MPNRIPTPGIKTPTVRKSPTAQRAVQPKTIKVTSPAKPMSPADRQAQAKRPAVGLDRAYKNKYGKTSWNNGYTN